ncbi:radical SAM/SPASM domain-containing protein [Methylobacterium aquaticum]|uniref:Arylsulfatase regulator n=1 Tax=Methylobacterium aquaticum TaxID=270351 RepID=A0A1Y0ZCC8_9HYPH|nr:radical SAM protein [Methylobacterium aquaticum]BAR47262.1 arylsulfatase regulator [Methylobacterium aquaticum]
MFHTTSPRHGIVVNLGDACNISCTYCFENKENITLSSSGAIDVIIDEIIQIANRLGKFSVSFYGGEPLMHFKDLKYFVEKINQNIVFPNKVNFGIATNGSLLRGEISEFLAIHEFDIQISIDGASYVHDIHRNTHKGGSSSQHIRHIIGRVKDFSNISARMTVSPETGKYFDESLSYIIGIGFCDANHRIKFDFTLNRTWTGVQIAECRSAFQRAAVMLSEHYSQGGQSFIEPLSRVLANDRVASSVNGKGGYCGAGCSQRYVSPNGDVYPCNRLSPSHDQDYSRLRLASGTLISSNLDESLVILHSGINRKPECSTCLAFHFCDQTCPARIRSSSGSFSLISETHCALTKITHSMGRQLNAICISKGTDLKKIYNKKLTK